MRNPAPASSRGANLVAQAARVTLGPKGRNVMIQRSFGAPIVTKDGVTVVKEIEFEDRFENMGAKIIREVATKNRRRRRRRDHHRNRPRQGNGERGISCWRPASRRWKSSAEWTSRWPRLDVIKAMAKPIKDRERMEQVATIAANGDSTIGKIIADAMEKVGKEGVITVEEGRGLETTLDLVEGMVFDRGYLSPYFVTNAERLTVELEEPLILFHEKKISDMRDLIPLLEQMVQAGRPLLIISEDVEGEALARWWLIAARHAEASRRSRRRASVIVARRCSTTWLS